MVWFMSVLNCVFSSIFECVLWGSYMKLLGERSETEGDLYS